MRISFSKRLVYIAIIIALMAVTAKLRIPIYIVPISLQSFFPLLVGAIFDKNTAAMSQIGYIIIGLLGLPIFSNGGGISYIFQPTFGYLLAMPLAAYCIAYFLEKRDAPVKSLTVFSIVFISSMIILFLGFIWLVTFLKIISHNKILLNKIIFFGVLIFIPGELLKSLIVTILYPRIKKFFI